MSRSGYGLIGTNSEKSVGVQFVFNTLSWGLGLRLSAGFYLEVHFGPFLLTGWWDV